MGNDIGSIYKHIQSQLSTLSIKKPFFHLQLLKHHPQSIQQELVSLLILTKRELIPFCVPQIPP